MAQNVFHPKSLQLFAFWVVLGSCLTLPAAAQTPHVRQGKDGRLEPVVSDITMTPEQQIKLGRQTAAQVEKQLPVLPASSPISRFVSQLGQRLASVAPGYKWPFEFHVVNQKEINAFALPGGPIFVNLGTVQAARNEAELAGVMAHEIGHVVMQHSARQASETHPYQIAGALGSVILGGLLGNSVLGELGQLGIQMGASGIIMKYSRTAETEADLMGSQIMYDAGYDPHALVTFFQQLKKQNGQGVPEFFSGHPDPGNRAETVQRIIARYPAKRFVTDTPEYDQVRQVALSQHPYTAQQIAQQHQGGGRASAVTDVAPSGGMRELNQRAFSVSYPANWRVFGDGKSSLVIAPASGVSQNQIAYGVSFGTVTSQNGQSLDELTQDVVRTLARNNPNMQVIGKPQHIKVNGITGRSLDLNALSPLQSPSGRQVPEHNWLITLPRSDGAALFMVYTAPESDFQKLRPTYESMLRSLRLR